MSYNRVHFQAKLAASYFYIANYIIGKPQSGLSTMTMGAAGVKIYEQLPYANLYNSALDLNYQVNNYWSLKSKFSYRRGTGKNTGNLPLIQPFTYNSGITYSMKSFSSEATVNGAAKQNKINQDFGESSLPAYVIFNMSASNHFSFAQQAILLKAGVENIFDTEYTTFADWNRLPRMGRNFFINLAWNF
jgi:iron complex outermembrane receptor protein